MIGQSQDVIHLLHLDILGTLLGALLIIGVILGAGWILARKGIVETATSTVDLYQQREEETRRRLDECEQRAKVFTDRLSQQDRTIAELQTVVLERVLPEALRRAVEAGMAPVVEHQEALHDTLKEVAAALTGR